MRLGKRRMEPSKSNQPSPLAAASAEVTAKSQANRGDEAGSIWAAGAQSPQRSPRTHHRAVQILHGVTKPSVRDPRFYKAHRKTPNSFRFTTEVQLSVSFVRVNDLGAQA